MVDWVDKCLAVSDLATLGTLGSVCWTAGGSICLRLARDHDLLLRGFLCIYGV